MKTIMLLLVGTALTCFVYGYGCILSPDLVDCELSAPNSNGVLVTASASGKDVEDCNRKACAKLRQRGASCPF